MTALSQITTGNVEDTRLAWVWTMTEGAGRSQPTPLVHDGIMYLVNPGHILQALDASNGKLIWEHRLGVPSTTATRNIGIYQDKIYLATNDARRLPSTRVPETRLGNDGCRRDEGVHTCQRTRCREGRSIQGLGGCGEFYEHGCYISAYDAATGKHVLEVPTRWRVSAPRVETPGANCRTCCEQAEMPGSPAATIPTSI